MSVAHLIRVAALLAAGIISMPDAGEAAAPRRPASGYSVQGARSHSPVQAVSEKLTGETVLGLPHSDLEAAAALPGLETPVQVSVPAIAEQPQAYVKCPLLPPNLIRGPPVLRVS